MSNHPDISPLKPTDLGSAQALVVEAGWNQVPADWEIFLALGHLLKIENPAGGLDGTAATLPYAGGFGWISMVLVTTAKRRQGLATQLLARCIAGLRASNLISVLDATPAGRAVYRGLGFADGWPISRWMRAPLGAGATAESAPMSCAGLRPMLASDLTAVTSFDAAAFGCKRGELLARLHARSGDIACLAETGSSLTGYLLGRNGRGADQIGPLVANDAPTAITLLDHALARRPGALLIDVLDRHAAMAEALTRRGFAIQRPYTRMTLDRAMPFGEERLMIAIAGPELG